MLCEFYRHSKKTSLIQKTLLGHPEEHTLRVKPAQKNNDVNFLNEKLLIKLSFAF